MTERWQTQLLVAMEMAIFVPHRPQPVSCKDQRPIEIDKIALLPQDKGRTRRKRCAPHVANHRSEPKATRLRYDLERFCQAPAFVEFDVRYIVAANKPGQI
jgi:hypothetical protein